MFCGSRSGVCTHVHGSGSGSRSVVRDAECREEEEARLEDEEDNNVCCDDEDDADAP